MDILGEYGQEDSVGELDAITASPRSSTVQAIRETEIVRMPAALFDAISVRHPETTLQFMRVIANQVRGAVTSDHNKAHAVSNTSNELRPDHNLSTYLERSVWHHLTMTRDRLYPWQHTECSCSQVCKQTENVS